MTESCVVVAMHVRRGDVLNHPEAIGITENSWYLHVADALASCLSHLSLEFHICIISEGAQGLFTDFSAPRFTLHLDEAHSVALHHLIHSDISVLGASAFSFTAALLHQGQAIITQGELFAIDRYCAPRSHGWLAAVYNYKNLRDCGINYSGKDATSWKPNFGEIQCAEARRLLD